MSWFSDLFTGIMGGQFGSGFSTVSANNANAKMQSESNDFNAQQAQINRNFQREERYQTQQWTEDWWKKQFDFEQQEWNRQFVLNNLEYDRRQQSERQYNSPANQAQLMRQAGMNPANVGLNGSGTAQTFAAPSAPSIPSPSSNGVSPMSGSTASAVTPPYIKTEASANALQAVGGFIKDISNANLGEEQRNRISMLLENELLQSTYDTAIKKNEVFLSSKNLPARFVKEWAEAYDNVLKARLTGHQIDGQKLQNALLNWQGELTHEQFLQAYEVTQNMKTAIALENALMRERAKTEKSAQSVNYAAASKSFAEAKTENEKRSAAVELLRTNVKQAKQALVAAKMGNWKTSLEILDKAFGTDTGFGAYVKAFFVSGDIRGDRTRYLELLENAVNFDYEDLSIIRDDGKSYQQLPKHKKR